MDESAFKTYLNQKQQLIDSTLDTLLPAEEERPYSLHRAMRYSLLAPGKRIRSLLCLAANQAVGGAERAALRTACALEAIHTYSLIHDDLPSMDDDDFRRGQPASHKVFGEAEAILAGDALLSFAFEIVAGDPELSDRQCRQVITELAAASGSRGLVGGQQTDISSPHIPVSLEILEFIHTRKTGALISAAVKCGGIVGQAREEKLQALATYGANIGLAFQIKDDILDVKGEREKLGKSTGKDQPARKITYPAVVGLFSSRLQLQELFHRGLRALEGWGEEAEPLRGIARFIVEREK